METLGNTKVTKSNGQKHTCEICDYSTSQKSNFTKHILTLKHIRLTQADSGKHKCACGKLFSHKQSLFRHKNHCQTSNETAAKVTKVTKCFQMFPSDPKNHICGCGNAYKSRSGLWKHKKMCLHNVDGEYDAEPTVDNTKVLEVLETVNVKLDKTEASNRVLREELKTIKTDMLTAVAEPKVINNYTNINIFLNDKCGDAMAIQDFAKELIICLEDVNYALENGKVSGIENIIRKKFGELGVYKRPLHCTDVKRGTLYVKGEEGWEKEKGEMNKMIRDVECIQTSGIKVWGDANPEYSQGNKKLMEKWLRIVHCLTNSIDGAGIRKIEKRCYEMSKISQDELA